MPEAPDLEVIREFLESRVIGLGIDAAGERKPLVLRNLTQEPFGLDAAGRTIQRVERLGKMLLIDLSDDRLVVINPMLTGGLRYCPSKERLRASAHVVFTLSNAFDIRYFDQKRMGMVYYLRPDQRGSVPRLDDRGPDVLDRPLSVDAFSERLRPYRGEIKGVLTRGDAVSGIGNAYADEILFAARIFPFKKRTRLSQDEIVRLHRAVYEVPAAAVDTLRERVGESIHKKVRDFLSVHGKGGEPCPVCGGAVTSITANQRLTNYCRRCQPGSLFR